MSLEVGKQRLVTFSVGLKEEFWSGWWFTLLFSSSDSGSPCLGPFSSGSLQVGPVTDTWHALESAPLGAFCRGVLGQGLPGPAQGRRVALFLDLLESRAGNAARAEVSHIWHDLRAARAKAPVQGGVGVCCPARPVPGFILGG